MAYASIFCANMPKVDPGMPPVARGSCIGDRPSSNLQQV